jgi:YHS domain-containing protein
MEVDVSTALWKMEVGGQFHYFCGPVCKQTFEENLERIIALETMKTFKTGRGSHVDIERAGPLSRCLRIISGHEGWTI